MYRRSYKRSREKGDAYYRGVFGLTEGRIIEIKLDES
jgi:hypothetical protein